MAKEIDANGFWFIKHNILSKEGVYPYLGSNIDSSLVPDKIYYVYRPASTLEAAVDSWNNPPKGIYSGHEMIGPEFTPSDDRPPQGVVTNVVYEDGALFGDITVYSEALQKEIGDGTKELSLGYFCNYVKEAGIFNGQAYDYVQKDMRGNHVAVVPNGRCGSEVRVYDSKCTMDALDIPEELRKKTEDNIINDEQSNLTTKGQEMEKVDKREFIRKIMAIAAKPADEFEGGDTEKVETIAKLLEKSEYSKSESGKANDEDEEKKKDTEDKCGKDEDVDKREFIRKIMAIAAKPADEFDGGDKEKVETIAKLLEKSEYSKSERGTANDENIPEILMYLKSLDEKLDRLLAKKVMDEDKDSEEKKEEGKDEDDKEDKKDEEKSKAQDAAIVIAEDSDVDLSEDAALKAYLA